MLLWIPPNKSINSMDFLNLPYRSGANSLILMDVGLPEITSVTNKPVAAPKLKPIMPCPVAMVRLAYLLLLPM